MALVLAERSEGRWRRRVGTLDVLLMLVIAGVPAVLILLQPDLGTMLVLSATVFGVLAVSGARRRWLVVVLLSAGSVAALALAGGVLKAYQVDRFLAFVNPDLDPRGAGYNVEQARIAIGNGGLFGQGLFHGSQTRSGFVPEQQTDFVFTVAGEELGLARRGPADRCCCPSSSGGPWSSPATPRTSSAGSPPPASPAGSASRPSRTSACASGSCPSPAYRCRSCRTAGRRLFAGMLAVGSAAEHPRAVAGADVRRAVRGAAGPRRPLIALTRTDEYDSTLFREQI